MTLALGQRGFIEARPDLHAVVKGNSITYRLTLEETSEIFGDDFPMPDFEGAADAPPSEPVEPPKKQKSNFNKQVIKSGQYDLDLDYTVEDLKGLLRWYVIYDHHTRRDGQPAYEKLAQNTTSVKVKWKYRGHHTVVCTLGYLPPSSLKLADLKKQQFYFTQHVSDVRGVQRGRMRRSRRKPPPHPGRELDVVRRYIEVIEASEKTLDCPAEKQREYRKELAQLRKYRDALEDVFAGIDTDAVVPLRASYTSKKTNEQIDLRICLSTKFDIRVNEASRIRIMLIDWTNPMHDKLRGYYVGVDESVDGAFDKAVAAWRENNSYVHPGNVVAEMERELPLIPKRRIEFSTDGPGFWGKLKDFFDKIALAAAVIAAVVTLVLPVPGSRVVSGLIWTSVATSTASAVISIGRRKRNGFGDPTDDALDVLTIAGNVLTAGRAGWARSALMQRKVGRQVMKYALYGSVALDGVEGVLISVDTLKQFEQILGDPSLSPKERADRMLELLRSGVVTGAMTYVNARAGRGRGKADLDEDMLRRMRDPRETIDLDAPPRVRGEAGQGRVRTRVQDEPQRLHRKGRRSKNRGVSGFRKPPSPNRRGMLDEHHLDICDQVQDTGAIVLVRDSNPAAVKWARRPDFAEPKPESLKAKTRTSGKYKGLAAADPRDPRLNEMLESMTSRRTGKPPKPYDEFVEDLDSKGYRVSEAGEEYIVRHKQTGKAFFSDMDLHGVYDAKTGRNRYSESFRGELNERFGGQEMVQHGPHDLWDRRNSPESGPNRGPQPPVTAYVPDGDQVRTVHLTSKAEMKRFYERYKIDWSRIYPDD